MDVCCCDPPPFCKPLFTRLEESPEYCRLFADRFPARNFWVYNNDHLTIFPLAKGWENCKVAVNAKTPSTITNFFLTLISNSNRWDEFCQYLACKKQGDPDGVFELVHLLMAQARYVLYDMHRGRWTRPTFQDHKYTKMQMMAVAHVDQEKLTQLCEGKDAIKVLEERRWKKEMKLFNERFKRRLAEPPKPKKKKKKVELPTTAYGCAVMILNEMHRRRAEIKAEKDAVCHSPPRRGAWKGRLREGVRAVKHRTFQEQMNRQHVYWRDLRMLKKRRGLLD